MKEKHDILYEMQSINKKINENTCFNIPVTKGACSLETIAAEERSSKSEREQIHW